MVRWQRLLAVACVIVSAYLITVSQAPAQSGAEYIQTQQFRGTAHSHYSSKTACSSSQTNATNQAYRFQDQLRQINPDHWISQHIKNADCQCRDNGNRSGMHCGDDWCQRYTCQTTITVDFYGK